MAKQTKITKKACECAKCEARSDAFDAFRCRAEKGFFYRDILTGRFVGAFDSYREALSAQAQAIPSTRIAA